MARKKKRLGRLPLDRLPYFMRKPRPGPGRRMGLDRSMLKPKGDPLGMQPRGPQQQVQLKGPPPDMKPKGPKPDVQLKGPPNNRVRPDKVSTMTTIVCWDLAPDVDSYQLENLLKDISGVLDVSFSSTRHCAVVNFATAIDAQMALYQLTGRCLKGHPLKFALFEKNSYDPNRDALPVMESMPGRVTHTIYVEGFDSSLGITEKPAQVSLRPESTTFSLRPESTTWRTAGRIITPLNPDGTSTGKAFVRFQSHTDFVAALERNGLDLGDGRKLYVTRWLELLNFPWHYKEKEDGNAEGGS